MSDEVLLSKSETVERCIRRIHEEYLGHEGELETNYTRQDSIILNLQRACEAAIDMANRLIKLKRLGYPKDSKDSFKLLVQVAVIPGQLGRELELMVGFRNIAVHAYQDLDLGKVRYVIEHRLEELAAFARIALKADPEHPGA